MYTAPQRRPARPVTHTYSTTTRNASRLSAASRTNRPAPVARDADPQHRPHGPTPPTHRLAKRLPINPSLVGSLTARQREVLALVAQDYPDKAIAHQLGIKERSVRAHIDRSLNTLRVRSRVGAAVALTEWRREQAAQDQQQPNHGQC